MSISLIVAMAENRVIGANKAMPWHLPEDLRRFREITLGHPVLMGRKTHEAIGRVLPGRLNLILTRDRNFKAEGCQVIFDQREALQFCQNGATLYVIGGAEVYRAMLPVADRIELTLLHRNFDGDTFFPDIAPKEWREISRTEHCETATVGFSWSYITLARV